MDETLSREDLRASAPATREPGPWGYAAAGFGIQAAWATLTAYLPASLEALHAAPRTIGLVMALDPLAALLFAPWLAALSDRTASPWGRRMPYVALGMGLATWALLALERAATGWQAALAAGGVCLALNGLLGPYRAVLADEFAPERHGATSGVQSLVREAGGLAVLLMGAWETGRLPCGPFTLAAILLAASGAITCIAIARPRNAQPAQANVGPTWWHLVRAPELRMVLVAQFAWWFAIAGAKVFVVLYLVHEVFGIANVGSSTGQAAIRAALGLLAVASAVGLLSSLPIGQASRRVGLRPVLGVGLFALAMAFAIAALARGAGPMYLVGALYGLGFATLQILAYPFLLHHKVTGSEGLAASLYHQTLGAGQIAALLSMGWLVEQTGSYRAPFWAALGAIAIAGMALARVPLPPTAGENVNASS
jgi:MFS family permease